ncbi:MAG TPA: TolC family protein [Firmicutes bacterium]|nr:TolC family protein [Bacillota bacterium]
MRHSSLKLVISLVCFIVCLTAYGVALAAEAPEAQEPLKLTVAQAVELALKDNPTVILQTFAVKEAELNVKIAKVNLKTTVTPQQLEDAEAALAAAEAQLQLTRQSQALAAREQYINVLKAQHTLELTGAAVAQANRNLTLVREKAAVGLATDNDLYEAESNLRKAEITQRTAEASLETQRIKFNQLLSRDLRAPFELVDDVQYEIPAWDATADTAKALAGRLDVAVAQRKLELAQRNLNVADPSYTPQAQIERLQMAVERAQIELDALTTTVILQVRDAILGLETAHINVELANAALEQQQKQLQVAMLRHDSGFITTADLADAQAAANVAEVQAVQAMYDQALAVTRYLNAIGAAAVPTAQD